MDCKNCWVMLLVVMAACAVITSGAEPAATTTETPKTTTASPETTTPSTTTTTTTTTTEPPTTAKPSTTTTPAAPTTVPPPIPGQSVWSVTDPVTNVTCIIANMTITAKITYPLEDSNKTSTKDVVLPASAMSEGACGASQNIKLSWDKNWLNIAFGKNDTQKLYFVNHVTLSVFADDKTFPNISSKLINTDLVLESSTEEFKTNLDQSYRCIREQTLPLSKANSSHSANLVLTKVQLQAFHSEQKVAFGAAQDCELDTPDIVPIAVGCALAALVLVVLVAYLVGRRRSQARGYVSM